jgi:hypothetical protein
MHLDGRWLPERIRLGAQLDEESGEETVTLDSGIIVTNQRWAEVLRRYNVAMVVMRYDDADLIALRQLWRDARRSHSFDMYDITDETDTDIVHVRFVTDLQIVAIGGGLYSVEPFSLLEDKTIEAS